MAPGSSVRPRCGMTRATHFEWHSLDKVAVKGRTQGTLVCELLGLKGEVPAEILAARDL